MNHYEALGVASRVARPVQRFHTGREIADRVVRAYLEARADSPDHIKGSATCGHIDEPAAELLLMDFAT